MNRSCHVVSRMAPPEFEDALDHYRPRVNLQNMIIIVILGTARATAYYPDASSSGPPDAPFTSILNSGRPLPSPVLPLLLIDVGASRMQVITSVPDGVNPCSSQENLPPRVHGSLHRAPTPDNTKLSWTLDLLLSSICLAHAQVAPPCSATHRSRQRL